MKKEKQNEKISFTMVDEVKTCFIDSTLLRKSKDGMFLFSFFSTLGDNKRVEQCRIALTEDHMKQMIDMQCRQTDYYPEKQNVSDEKVDK